MSEAFLVSAALSPLAQASTGLADQESTPRARAGRAVSVLEQALRTAGVDRSKVDAVFWGGDERARAGLVGQGWGVVIGVEAGELSTQAALHLAAQAIMTGDVRLALVGGASLGRPAAAPGAALLRRANAWARRRKLSRASLDAALPRAADPRPGVDAAVSSPPPLPALPQELDPRVTRDHFLPTAAGAAAVLLAAPSAVGALNLAPRAGLLARALASSGTQRGWDAVFTATRQALRAAGAEPTALERARVAAAFVGVELAWQEEFGLDAARLAPMRAVYGPATGLIGLIGLVEALESGQARLGLLAGVTPTGDAAATLIERT